MTALPLVRRGGQWVDFELPKGHVVEPLLRMARVLELNRVYADQAALIEKIHGGAAPTSTSPATTAPTTRKRTTTTPGPCGRRVW
jgi:hypothetical protein